jgi:predicted metal-dependent hydrolase
MLLASVIFWAKVVEHQARLMRADGTLRSPAEWAALVRFLFVEPGGMGRLLREYLAYFRPDFHPGDIDSGALVDAWVDSGEAAPYLRPRPRGDRGPAEPPGEAA